MVARGGGGTNTHDNVTGGCMLVLDSSLLDFRFFEQASAYAAVPRERVFSTCHDSLQHSMNKCHAGIFKPSAS